MRGQAGPSHLVQAARDAWPSGAISGAVEPSLRSDRSLLPGNGILPPETNVRKRSPKSDLTFAETDRSHTTVPIRGVSTKGRKISVREGLCGGAERTRTACQPRRRE